MTLRLNYFCHHLKVKQKYWKSSGFEGGMGDPGLDLGILCN